jgi:hypothetical protein
VERRILLAFSRMMRMCRCGGEGGELGGGGVGEGGFVVVVGRGDVGYEK